MASPGYQKTKQSKPLAQKFEIKVFGIFNLTKMVNSAFFSFFYYLMGWTGIPLRRERSLKSSSTKRMMTSSR